MKVKQTYVSSMPTKTKDDDKDHQQEATVNSLKQITQTTTNKVVVNEAPQSTTQKTIRRIIK